MSSVAASPLKISILLLLFGLYGCTSQPAVQHVQAWQSDPAEVGELRHKVGYLASDSLQGRLVGTAGLDAAADYIAAHYRKLGLRTPADCDGYFQPFQYTVSVTVGEKTALRRDDTTFVRGKDFTSLPLSAVGDFSGKLVVSGYGITDLARGYDDYAGVDAKGAIAVAMRFEPHDDKGRSRFTKGTNWSSDASLAAKANNAAAHGAVALIVVNPPNYHGPDYLLPASDTGNVGKVRIPVLMARQSIIDFALEQSGQPDLKSLQAQIDRSGQPHSFAIGATTYSGNVELIRKQATVKNVLAVLPGFGPHADEYIVVGAHYDHLGHGGPGSLAFGSRAIHYGADDNASGTAAVLELAERLTRGGRLERSILFANFTAEEEGLIGSQHFIDHPPVPLDKIVAMLNYDMVGRVRNEQLFIGGGGTAESFDAMLNSAGTGLPLKAKQAGPYIGRGGFGPSDHMSFAMKKIPVLFFFSGMHADYHTPGDIAAKVNYPGIEETVEFGQRLIHAIANAPRAEYVSKFDSQMSFGMGTGGGSRTALGVVPDYATDDTTPGVRISGTRPGSAAESAGLKGGDIITAVGASNITTLQELSDFLASAKPGDKVKVVYLRDKQRMETQAVLGERKG